MRLTGERSYARCSPVTSGVHRNSDGRCALGYKNGTCTFWVPSDRMAAGGVPCVSNFRLSRSSSDSLASPGLCWPITHGRSATQKLVTVKGTVMEFTGANPHPMISLDGT